MTARKKERRDLFDGLFHKRIGEEIDRYGSPPCDQCGEFSIYHHHRQDECIRHLRVLIETLAKEMETR